MLSGIRSLLYRLSYMPGLSFLSSFGEVAESAEYQAYQANQVKDAAREVKSKAR